MLDRRCGERDLPQALIDLDAEAECRRKRSSGLLRPFGGARVNGAQVERFPEPARERSLRLSTSLAGLELGLPAPLHNARSASGFVSACRIK